jgi:methylmalonyl-CoA mutase C-terminal domain/subunit
MAQVRVIRCLLGMLGTDVHSKGIRTLASWLRDQGIEVIYFGEHNTVEGIVNGVVQEDVDLLGLSFSSSGYLAYVERVVELMRVKEVGDIALMVGGQIHPSDQEKLKALGVSGIFGAGTTKADVLDYIKQVATQRNRNYPTPETQD